MKPISSPRKRKRLRLPTKRRLIQLYAALLFNANLRGFATGRIYTGRLKNFCAPGLNCYSCPGAVASCPLGALQNALSDTPHKAPFYIFGILVLYGLLFGRWICGFLCPFGLLQDLLYKIKTRKFRKNRLTRALTWTKYVLLGVLAIGVPLIYALREFPLPGFCKYICPAGTLEGAVSLLIHPENRDMWGMLGGLFSWKIVVLVLVLVASVFIFRPFCRFLCPLGAIYSLFSRVALIGVRLDAPACVECGLCRRVCGMDIRHVGDRECIHCGACIPVCPTAAIQWKGPRILLPPQATGQPIPTRNPAADEANSVPLTAASTPETVQKKPTKEISPRARRVARISLTALLAALLVVVLLFVNLPMATSPAEGFEVGDRCPTLTLAAVDGGEAWSLARDLADNRVVVMNFWGTWCGPCIEELPHFDRVATQYADNVRVVAIHSVYRADTAADWVAAHYSTSAIRFVADTAATTATGDAYAALGGVGDYPMTLIVSSDGRIAYTHRGSLQEAELIDALERVLSQA